MKYLIALMVALTFSAGAFAAEDATSELSWTAPDTRMNGDKLDPTEIKEFRIYQGLDIEEPLAITDKYTAVTGENAAEITVQLPPRPEPYVMSFAITTVDNYELESEISKTVTKAFEVEPTSKPNAPTSLTFTVTCPDGAGCSVKEAGTD
ncbi:MAG: hypothetical protein ACTHWH_06055 [Marinobacter sp.]